MKLRVGKNLQSEVMELADPSEFSADESHPIRSMSKAKRHEFMSKDKTEWQIYSCFEGHAPNLRISDANPAKWMSGFAADYDRKYTVDEAVTALESLQLDKKNPGKHREIYLPNDIESTLSGNIRLRYQFERMVPLPSKEFEKAFVELLVERLHIREILLGYDKNSEKSSQVWTNSGVWAGLDQPVIPWVWLRALMMEVSKKAAFRGEAGIPLELIAAEFEARWPGKWKGEFKLDETGVRVWDEKADNEAGCQIKLDGMICFTGPHPFRSWTDILGADWVKTNTELNIGKIIEDFRFLESDNSYYQLVDGIWQRKNQDGAMRALRVRGVSAKIPKGETASPIDHMLEHISNTNKISGVGPVVSRPFGLLDYKGQPFLNTANIVVPKAVKGATGTTADFPLILAVLELNNAVKGKVMPIETLFFWARRSYLSQRDYRQDMGQAMFFCGPKNSGKTLTAVHVFGAMLGGQYANPYSYFTGQTEFNVELFSKPVLMVNDEESPGSDAEKRRMHAKIKSSVVNPTQTVHAKFRTPTILDWCGRVIWTLNDDPGDTYQLPEIVPSNEDKIMFFRVLTPKFAWGSREETESQIAKELPAFLWWVTNVYQPPQEILEPGRMGVKSYFDPKLRAASMQNTTAFSVWELLEQWIARDEYWNHANGKPSDNETWIGSASELLTVMHSHDSLKPLLQGVTAKNLPNSLTTLSKQKYSGVEIDPESPDGKRHFIVHRGLANS